MMEDQIDVKLLLRRALKYWYLFPLFLPAFLGVAYYYLKVTQPSYEASAMLLIKDSEQSGQLNEESVFDELGLGKTTRNLLNEQAILASTPLMLEVVKEYQLNYEQTQVGTFQKKALYKNSPIRILNWEPADPEAFFFFVIQIDDKGGYRLEVTEEEFYKGEFGTTLDLPYGKLTLTFEPSYMVSDPILVQISPPKSKANELAAGLTVEMVNEKASLLSITYRDLHPQRAQDVVEGVVNEYNDRTVEGQNQVYVNTIDLINDRIQLITEELSEAEQDVQQYKQRFSMVELSAEGNMLMNDLAGYNKQISETEVQMAILKSIGNFLEENRESFEFVPTNTSLTNLTLNNQLGNFNTLLSQKQKLTSELGPSHPDLKLVEKQIRNLRETIIENVKSIESDLKLTLNASSNLKGSLETRLKSLPQRERELIEIERRKSVKENLYLYLLEKREEAALSMAVSMPKGIVVEPPEASWSPVSPKKAQIWLIALFLGMAIPMGIVLLLMQLDNKIHSEEDVERLTSVPLAGILAQSKKKVKIVVRENSRSASAEMFRMLRANLSYISQGAPLKSILITSGVSGEGKSFITLNLGITLALGGKRVVILESDLRKPTKIGDGKHKGEFAPMGIVNYIVDPNTHLHQIIRKSEYHINLDIIGCGPKPPNPSELVLSERYRYLIDELKEQYDYILIDTPPVGIVADALQMKDLAEATLFITRAGYTRKNQLGLISTIAEKNKLPRPFIVLNGIRLNAYYGYGNYGGYVNHYISSHGYFEKEA